MFFCFVVSTCKSKHIFAHFLFFKGKCDKNRHFRPSNAPISPLSLIPSGTSSTALMPIRAVLNTPCRQNSWAVDGIRQAKVLALYSACSNFAANERFEEVVADD
jgi:hypothetical protein